MGAYVFEMQIYEIKHCSQRKPVVTRSLHNFMRWLKRNLVNTTLFIKYHIFHSRSSENFIYVNFMKLNIIQVSDDVGFFFLL